ncbi:hypothetical protein ACQY0O_003272 [Thecaphora frezii]
MIASRTHFRFSADAIHQDGPLAARKFLTVRAPVTVTGCVSLFVATSERHSAAGAEVDQSLGAVATAKRILLEQIGAEAKPSKRTKPETESTPAPIPAPQRRRRKDKKKKARFATCASSGGVLCFYRVIPNRYQIASGKCRPVSADSTPTPNANANANANIADRRVVKSALRVHCSAKYEPLTTAKRSHIAKWTQFNTKVNSAAMTNPCNNPRRITLF